MAGEDDTAPLDDANGLLDMVRREKEEKARNLIERGNLYPPNARTFPAATGGGLYASVVRATIGENESKHIKHLHVMRMDDEARHPEIYPWRRTAKAKQGNYCRIEPDNTTHITKDEFINLYSAVCFANRDGVALTTHVTIQWGYLGYADHVEAAAELQEGFFKPLHGWYNDNIGWYIDSNNVRFNDKNLLRPHKHGVKVPHKLFWIYSNEVSHGGDFHTHVLVGIPIEMRAAFRVWVRDRVATLSKKQPVPKEVVKVVSPPSSPITRQWILFHYLCKGLDPKATVEIPGYQNPVPMADLIEKPYCSPGHMTCKNRIGMSRNLGRTQRKETGFLSPMELGVFDKRRTYTSELYDAWHKANPWSSGDLRLLDI